MGELESQPTWTEPERLTALRQYAILDTPREVEFDDIVKIAAHVCDAPIAVVNLIDEARQWFKAEVGLGARETALDVSICKHALLEPDLFIVPDTSKDERFKGNPLVTGAPGLRFYAGAVLKTADGIPLGTVCVLDYEVRELTAAQADTLKALARQVMTLLELRRSLAAHAASEERQNLLIRELHHRVRNTLATVQGMLGATARSTSSADEFYRSFTARIESLARTHAIITGADGQVVLLRDLLWSELEAFTDPNHQRVKLEGPDIQLPSAVAVPFGMAFHELTINAVKFGALSAAHGHVEVRWGIHSDAGVETLHIDWLEQGGPRLKEPTHRGLGSRLVKRVLTTQAGAEVKTEYHPDGLRFTVDAPMSSITQP
ncbi:MAG TPA: HWE histidine kinase domain-containing protein [Microvirga sp.]|nr:HWE histidine kinase domain-containing protein [Microvirga sp.]